MQNMYITNSLTSFSVGFVVRRLQIHLDSICVFSFSLEVRLEVSLVVKKSGLGSRLRMYIHHSGSSRGLKIY